MKISECKELLTEIFHYNIRQWEKGLSDNTYLVPCFLGDPGVGKTAIPRQVARELDISHYCTIVAQYDAGEMGGLPYPQEIEYEMEDGSTLMEKRMARLRPSYMPDHMTAAGQVAIWNLDELPQAVLANQNIVSQLVNEYRIGEHIVNPGVTMCATGNKPENKAGTTPMPSHLKDRLTFLTVETDYEEWLAHSAQVGMNPDIRGFIRKNPSCLHQFKVGVNSFPSPRSWEKVSNILTLQVRPHVQLETIGGQIGDDMAGTFIAYLRIKDRYPDPAEVCRDPMNAPVFGSPDADVLYMLISNLVEIATPKNLDGMTTYLGRLPNKEFCALWFKDLLLRHPEYDKNQHVTKFAMEHLAKVTH
jgi:hypothetical protein